MGFDFTAAVRGGLDNDRINEMAGTTGKDYIKAINSGYTNEELDSLIAGEQQKVTQSKGTDTLAGSLVRGVENTGQFLKSGFSEFASGVNAIPANIYESLGMEDAASKAREGQKYWQESYQNAQKRLNEDYDPLVSKIGSSLYNPINLLTMGVGGGIKTGIQEAPTLFNALSTPAKFGAIGASDTASHIAATGDMSGISGEDIKNTAIGGGTAFIAPAAITAAGRGLWNATNRPFSGVSSEAYNVGREAGMTMDEVERYVANIPKDQQARYIAETQGQATRGTFAGAFQGADNAVRVEYGKSLNTRSTTAEIAVNKASYNETSEAVSNQFDALADRVAFENTGRTATLDIGQMIPELENVRNSFLGTPLEGKINGIINRIGDGRVNSPELALDAYRALNELFGRAKTRADKRSIKLVKDEITTYLRENTSESTMKLIDASNQNYARLMRQKDAMKILDDSTKIMSEGSAGEVRAINWSQLKNKLKEENLDSPEANALLDIAERYSKKFGTRDVDFLSKTNTQAINPVDSLATEGSGFFQRIGISKLGNFILDNLPFNDAAALRRAQFDIAKAIKNSHSPKQFLEKVQQSDFVAENINKQTKRILAKESEEVVPQSGSGSQNTPPQSGSQPINNNSVNTNMTENIVSDVERAVDTPLSEEVSASVRQAETTVAEEEARMARQAEESQQSQVQNEINTIEENTQRSVDGVGVVRRDSADNFTVRVDGGEDPQSAIESLRRAYGDNIQVTVTRNSSPVRIYRPASNAIQSEISQTNTNYRNELMNSIASAGERGAETVAGRARIVDSVDGRGTVVLDGETASTPSVAMVRNIIQNLQKEGRNISLKNQGLDSISLRHDASFDEITEAADSYVRSIRNRISSARQQSTLNNIEDQVSSVASREQATVNVQQPNDDMYARARNFFGISEDGWRSLTLDRRKSYVQEMKEHPEYKGTKEKEPKVKQFDMSRASGKVGHKLNKTLKDWDVAVDGDRVTARHSEFGSFSIYKGSGNTWSMYTGSLRNGSGAGSTIYPAAWDAIEKAGGVYKPSNTLSTANPVKMTINMIAYMAKRKRDANHILINRSQRGGSNLNNAQLTVENTKQLVLSFRSWLNRSRHMPTGQNISARSTDAQIEQWANNLGRDPYVRLGKNSLKLLRKLLRNNGDVTAFGAIILALSMQDDFKSAFEIKEEA